MIRGVRAALLAGGRGERLGRLTDRNCKPLVPYAGVCRLVDFSLANVVHAGIPEVVLLSAHGEQELIAHLVAHWDGRYGVRVHYGPHDELVRRHMTRGTGAGSQLQLADHPAERGTADALLTNAQWIFAPGADDLLLLHADHVYVFDYDAMVQAHRESRADVTIGVQEIERRFVPLFGMVEMSSDGSVERLVEKPAEPTSTFVFTAFCVFRIAALAQVMAAFSVLPEDDWQHDVSRDVLPMMIAGDYQVRAFPIPGYWADIGTLDRYVLGHLSIVRSPHALPLARLPRTLPRAESMRMHPGRVLAGAPPSRAALVREAVLYPGSVVEAGTQIERSVVLPNGRVCRGAVVRDTVVLEGETMAGGRVGVGDLP